MPRVLAETVLAEYNKARVNAAKTAERVKVLSGLLAHVQAELDAARTADEKAQKAWVSAETKAKQARVKVLRR